MLKAFSELQVLELATVLAGPAVGQFLAELGADVWKIEPPTGDVTRSWRTQNEAPDKDPASYFSSVNWGKRNICLDLKNEEERKQLFRALEQTDVLIVNYRPGADARLGLSYKQLKMQFPALIYASISGYGSSSDRAGYDAVIQAESGFMYLNREPDGKPQKMPVALMDLLAAHQLKQAILWALYQRGIDGKGRAVSVSLIEAGVSALANQASAYLFSGEEPQPMGSEHPTVYPYGTLFGTSDGVQLLLAIGSDRQFSAFCTRLGVPELAADDRFATNTARVRNRRELHQHLQTAIQTQDSVSLLDWCHAHAVPAGRVRCISEALNDPSVQALWFSNGRGLRTAAFLPATDRVDLNEPAQAGAHRSQWLQLFGA